MRNNIPKITFRRSWLYDQALKRRHGFKMPSEKATEKHTKILERKWGKIGPKILREIAIITGLRWREKEIVCYITAGVIPYSDPLTLNLKSDIDTLTHELIHRILSESENWNIIYKGWNRLTQKYKNEPLVARNHVAIHAIHTAILLKLFGKKRLQKEKVAVMLSSYIRSWNIVDRDGYENIIRELKRK